MHGFFLAASAYQERNLIAEARKSSLPISPAIIYDSLEGVFLQIPIRLLNF
jgi:hypothetical protein